MEAQALLLLALLPSGGFALLAAQGGSLGLALIAYYAAGPLWWALGRTLRGVYTPPLRGPVPLAALALALPYPVYWLGAGLLGRGLREAYGGFLQGPGVGVPLVVLLLWPLGWHLPPVWGGVLVFLGAQGALWWRRWRKRYAPF